MALVLSWIDSDPSPAHLEIYTDSYAQLLGSLELAKPSFTQNGATLNLIGPRIATGLADGSPRLAVIRNGKGDVVASDLSVGAAAECDINLSNDIWSGAIVTIHDGALTHG